MPEQRDDFVPDGQSKSFRVAERVFNSFFRACQNAFGESGSFLTLQAWFDDSGTKGTGRWMTMSGLFGEAELFASIAEEWDRHLRAKYPGAIRYFKMDEACQLDGEFKDWKQENRDMKVLQMSKLIDRQDLVEISARVDLRAFGKTAASWSHIKPEHGDAQRHHSMGQPYLLLFQYVLVTATTEAVERGATSPIEIGFDDQSIFSRTVLAGYSSLREDERDFPDRFAVMPVRPWFRKDQEFVILQAADMLAGELRLTAEDYEDNPSFIGTLCPHLTVSRHLKDIGEADLNDLHEHLVQTLEREEGEAHALHKLGGCEED